MITKIFSGGQTGADRGGLDAAIHCEIPHGGWCPKGRKAEDGVIPVEYHLNEMVSSEYLPRTKAMSLTPMQRSSSPMGNCPVAPCRPLRMPMGKPYHDVNLEITTRRKAVEEIVWWLGGDADLNDYDEYQASPPSECILNVAGSRESHAPGIQDAVCQLMVDVLIAVNPACQKFYRPGEAK